MEAEQIAGRGSRSARTTRRSSASTGSRSGPSGAIDELPWNDRPTIPELRGSPEKQARRRDVWRSVITQQLQADELAVEMSAQLFSMAPHHEAKMYYSTMVQDESRHCEAWLTLVGEVGGTAERDPHLDQARADHDRGRHARGEGLPDAGLLRAADHPEVQGDRPRNARDRARGSLQPARDRRRHPSRCRDGVRARAARAATKKTKDQLVKAANRLLPVFVEHEFWRPRERAWMGERDAHRRRRAAARTSSRTASGWRSRSGST